MATRIPATTGAAAVRGPQPLSMSVQYGVQGSAPERRRLRRWARRAALRPVSFTLRFVDEQEGRALNSGFRRRDYATNVLTFVYDELDEVIHGDIVLCVPVVEREAREQGKRLEAHYAHLLVHGLLHLQGYDHEKARDARVMEALEIEIVTALGYDNPYPQ